MLLSGEINGQGIEVIADHFGTDVLTSGQPAKARSVFKFDARMEQAEHGGLTDAAPAFFIEQAQANLGCIGCQDTQSVPKRLCWNAFIDQSQQFSIERVKNVGHQATAGLGKCAGGDDSGESCSLRQQGKEAIELCLHGTPNAREQKGNQIWKG